MEMNTLGDALSTSPDSRLEILVLAFRIGT